MGSAWAARNNAKPVAGSANPWPSSLCTWNAYVEAGKDLAERRARLAEVPEAWREGVKRHLACVFAIRNALGKRGK
jgi:hypothetical protein